MNKLKLSVVYTALLTSGLLLNAQQAVAESCISSTLTSGISKSNENVLLEKCNVKFSQNDNKVESIKVENGTLNIRQSDLNANVEKSYGYGFIITSNATDTITNSNITLNSQDNTNPKIFNIKNTQLDLNHSNITYTSNGNRSNIVLCATNSTVNIDSSKITSSSKDQTSAFFVNVVTMNTENSTIKLNNSDVSVTNDSRIFYMENSTLDITNSNLTTIGGDNASFSSLAMMNTCSTNITLDNSHFNLTNSKALLTAQDGNVTATNITVNQVQEQAENSLVVSELVSLKNSEATFSTSTINSNKGNGAFLVQNSNLTLNNNNITYTNSSDSFLFGHITNSRNNININQTNLTAARGFINVRSFDNLHNEPNFLAVNINNSTLETTDLFVVNGEGTLIANNASLSGRISASDTFLVLNHSKWVTTKQSDVKDLQANNGSIVLDYPREDHTYRTFKIYGNLSGNVNFTLNTDLSAQNSDEIIVGGTAEGNHTITVRDSGKEPKYKDGSATLVRTQAGDATFKLADKDYVDAGAYRYRLFKQNNNWILSSKEPEPVKPVEPVTPVEPSTPTPAEPVDTVTPAEPSTPTEPVEIVTPVEPSTPTPAEPVDTVTPAEPSTPTEPVEIVTPVEPSTPAEPVDTVTPAEPSTPTEPVEIVTPVEPSTPTEPVEIVTPVVPSTSTEPMEIVTPAEPIAQRMLSETSNSLVSLRQAQFLLAETNLNSLHQRLGELHNGEQGRVWVRSQFLRQEVNGRAVSSDSVSSGFSQDVATLQLGADKAISESWHVGAFVGTSQAKLDLNGEYGKAKLTGVNGGLYATFLAQNGFYLDNIVKYERLRASIDGAETENYNSYTLSTEIGKAFQFGEGWAITPQAQVGWTHFSGNDNVDSVSALTTRIGARLSKSIMSASGSITPFIEINGINSYARHNQVRVNQYAFDVKNTGSRVEAVVGLSANLANHRLGVQFSTAKGNHVKQPLAVQLNYRYSW